MGALLEQYLHEQQQQQSQATQPPASQPAADSLGGSPLLAEYHAAQGDAQLAAYHAQPASAEGERQPLLQRLYGALQQLGSQPTDVSPFETLGRDVYSLGKTFLAQTGKDILTLGQSLAAESSEGAEQPAPVKETALAGGRTLATVLSGPAEQEGAALLGGSRAAHLLSGAGVGALAGTLYNPDDPTVGAILGGVLGGGGGALHTPAPTPFRLPEGVSAADLVARAQAGGFTVDPRTGEFPAEGFAVAGAAARGEATALRLPPDQLTPDAVQSHVAANGAYFTGNPNAMYGGWINPESGLAELEPSEVLPDKGAAILRGASVSPAEQAIYDLKAGENVPVPPLADIMRLAEERGIDPREAAVVLSDRLRQTTEDAAHANSTDTSPGAPEPPGGPGGPGGSGPDLGEDRSQRALPSGSGAAVGSDTGAPDGDGGRALSAPAEHAAGGGAGDAGGGTGDAGPAAALGAGPDIFGQTVDPETIDDYFNRAKIATGDKFANWVLDQEMQRSVGQLGPKTRMSRAEMLAMAKELAANPADLARGAGLLSKEAVIAARLTIRRNILAISGLTRSIADGTIPDSQMALNAIERLDLANNQLLNRLAPTRSEWGRMGVALQMAANQTTDPVYWLMKAKQMNGGADVTGGFRSELMARLAAIDNAPTPLARAKAIAQLTAGMRRLQQSSLGARGAALVRANMLSQPASFLRATGGHMLFGALRMADDYLAAGIDGLLGALPGWERTRPGFNVLADLKARARGVRLGIARANNILRYGASGGSLAAVDEVRETQFLTPEIAHALHLTGRIAMAHIGSLLADRYTKMILRAYAYVPEIIRTQAFQASLEERGRTIGIRAGLQGGALSKFMADFRDAPDLHAVAAAAHDAEIAALTHQGTLARLTRGIKSAAKVTPVTETAANLVLPFTTVPSNVVEQSIAHSPLVGAAMLNDLVTALRADLPAERFAANRAFVTHMAQGGTGLALLATGFALAREGRVSGPRADTPQLRNTALAAGRQPDSFRLSNMWYEGNLAPVTTLIELGAEYHDLLRDNYNLPMPAKAAQVAKDFGKIVEGAPFLEGIKDVQDAVSDPATYGSKYVDEVARGVVPGFVAHIETGTDPYQRAPQGFWQTIESRIPGLAERVPIAYDQFGQPITHQTGLVAAATPFRAMPDKTGDPAVAALLENDVGLSALKPIPGETADEFLARQQRFGTLLHTSLTNIATSDAFARIPEIAAALQANSPAFHDADVPAVTRALRRQILEQVISEVHAAANASANPLRGVPRELQSVVHLPSGRGIH